MNQQSSRTLIETRTTMAPADVLGAAKEYFALRPSIYAAFVEQESEQHLSLRGQGGEEIVLAVRVDENGTAVTGSTYMFDQQLMRFFATLPPAPPAAEPVPEPAHEAPAAAAGAAS